MQAAERAMAGEHGSHAVDRNCGTPFSMYIPGWGSHVLI